MISPATRLQDAQDWTFRGDRLTAVACGGSKLGSALD
jgi:hypothetical protein